MSEIAIVDPALQVVSDAPAGQEPRKRTVQIGAAMLTAASLMYFGGLFGVYLSTRRRHNLIQEGLEAAGESTTPWIPGNVRVELTAPTITTWTLLISLVTMQWAVYSFKRNDRRHGLLAIAVTAMFGFAVINMVSFQWGQLGLVIDSVGGSAAAPLIYAITASHVIMIVVALVMLLFAAFRGAFSSETRPHLDSINAAAVFWYTMVGLYFVIWIMVFITK